LKEASGSLPSVLGEHCGGGGRAAGKKWYSSFLAHSPFPSSSKGLFPL